MKIKDYIQGKRHGREANQLEREAMNDPFLQDAIDGFDSVQGNHLPIIEELERTIEKKSKKRIIFFRYITISIAASVAMLIGFNLIFQNKKPFQNEISQVNEILSESIDTVIEPKEEIAFNQKRTADEKAETKPKAKPAKSEKQIVQEIMVVDDEVMVNRDKTENASEIILADTDILKQEVLDDQIISPANTNQVEATTKPRTEKNITTTSNDAKKTITGRVIDESGEPVIGASVFMNEKNATITDLDGNFSLPKIDGQKITAKYIGYQPNVVDVQEDTNVIQLQPDNLALNEVVVVGSGRKSKKNVTGSIAAVENKTTSRVSGVQESESTEKDKFEKEEFRQFIFKNLKENICDGKSFSLTATLKTDKTGKPYDVKVLKSNCSEFEEEFLRLIKICPAWTTVNQKITLRITKP